MSYSTFQQLGKDVNKSQQSVYKVERVTSKEHRDKIIKENLIVLIDNYTDWCAPCKKIAPQFAQLAKKYEGKCYFLQENSDDEIQGAYPVTGVPCFHWFINGNFINDAVIVGGDLNEVENTLTK